MEAFFEQRNEYDLANSVLQCLTSFERWNLHSRDRNFLGWVAWVDTLASSALGNTECSKTSDCQRVSFLKFLCNKVCDCLKSVTSCTLCNTSSICNVCNKFLLGHKKRGKKVKNNLVPSLRWSVACTSHCGFRNGLPKPKKLMLGFIKPKNTNTNDDHNEGKIRGISSMWRGN